MPLISVIVPVYKVEPYLRRCVDSILAQSFSDFELILIDDGSPDNCGAICDEYAEEDERVKTIHKRNGGVSSARNAGLEIATGKYAAFCDSDDYVGKNWLECLLDLKKNTNADLVSTGFIFIHNGLEEVTCHADIGSYSLIDRDVKDEFLANDVLGGKLGWAVWTKLFDIDIIRKNKLHFSETCENFAEDLGFVLEYLLFCEGVAASDSHEYYYCYRDDSAMGSNANVFRFNALNEVSYSFGQRYLGKYDDRYSHKLYSVFHYLIMNNQYSRIVNSEYYPRLGEELKKIKKNRWFRVHTKAAFSSRKLFERVFGRAQTQKILFLSLYCLHRNWKLHTYLSWFFYRFIYSES